jgi:RNA polymerase sigma-70 factor (ECF subfamily)
MSADPTAASPNLPPDRAAGGNFATTQWSLVLSAGDKSSPRWRESLAELCRVYWYPLYAFIRRRGKAAAEAEDLTQEFFLRLVEKEFLHATGPEKGRFRTFLLLCMKRFLANEHDFRMAAKRGGGEPLISIDGAAADSRFRLEPADATTPEHVFERRWALALLEQVLTRMENEYQDAGKSALFVKLKPLLVADSGGASYAEIGRELSLSEGAVKVAVHRLRRRYSELLHAEVARTLEHPRDVHEEIRALFGALRGAK